MKNELMTADSFRLVQAVTAALGHADWVRQEDPDSAQDELTYNFFRRPSGVVDVFVVGDGGGYTSDVLFHVGFLTLRETWMETFCGSDEVPSEYFSGPAELVHELTVPALV